MTIGVWKLVGVGSIIVGCSTASSPDAQSQSANARTSSASEDSESGVGASATNAPLGRTLFDYLTDTQANEVQLTTGEVFIRSLAIVKGRIGSVAEGRNIDLVAQPGHPTAMAVIEILVDEAFKGDVGEAAYFEFIRGGASAEDLGRNLPDEPIIAFLGPSDVFDDAVERADDDSRGLPEGEALFRLTTQRGLIVDAGGTATQPLEPDNLLFPQARSFEEVEQSVLTTLSATP